ncbi:MAG: hypothetical protein ABI357_03600 [Granulicella sp.]
MNDDTNPDKQGQTVEKSLLFLKSLLIVAIVTAVVFAISFIAFHVAMPDCAPGQQDGQCGLATFLAFLYSFAPALTATLVTSVYLFVRNRRNRLSSRGTVAI